MCWFYNGGLHNICKHFRGWALASLSSSHTYTPHTHKAPLFASLSAQWHATLDLNQQEQRVLSKHGHILLHSTNNTTGGHTCRQLSVIKSAWTTTYWRLVDHFSHMWAILVEKYSIMAYLLLLKSISSAVALFSFLEDFNKKRKGSHQSPVFTCINANLVMRTCYVFCQGFVRWFGLSVHNNLGNDWRT